MAQDPALVGLSYLPHDADPESFSLMANPIPDSEGILVVKYVGREGQNVLWTVAFMTHPGIGCGIVTPFEQEGQTSSDAFESALKADPFFRGMSDVYTQMFSEQQ